MGTPGGATCREFRFLCNLLHKAGAFLLDNESAMCIVCGMSQSVPAKAKDVLSESQRGFLSKFDVLVRSGVGVLMIHSREPHRVTRAIRNWNAARPQTGGQVRPYREWNFKDGWLDYQTDMSKRPEGDGKGDPGVALNMIASGKDKWQGIFVMELFHFALEKKIPSMIACLKQYVRDFSTEPQRLIFVVPETYQLPLELENDIPAVTLELPSRSDLRTIFDNIILSTYPDGTPASRVVSPWNEDEIQEMLSLGAGMTENEFAIAVSKVVATYKAQWPKVPIEDARIILSAAKVEVIERTDVLKLMATTSINDVGGLPYYKEWLRVRRKAFSPDAVKRKIDPPKGCLLIGPPGTGKSLCAKATAYAMGQPLIEWNVGRMMNSHVGQSEARTRMALAMIEKMAPCVIFFDEADKMGIDPRRPGGDSGVGQRILQALLTFMQESKAPVFWVVTANRHDTLPPEFISRLDDVFAILPPSRVEREEILSIHLAKRGHDPKGLDLNLALDVSQTYVGRELEKAVKEANLTSFNDEVPLDGELLKKCVLGIKPASKSSKEDFDAMVKWAELNARLTSPQDPTPPKRGGANKDGQETAAQDRKLDF